MTGVNEESRGVKGNQGKSKREKMIKEGSSGVKRSQEESRVVKSSQV